MNKWLLIFWFVDLPAFAAVEEDAVALWWYNLQSGDLLGDGAAFLLVAVLVIVVFLTLATHGRRG